MAAIGTALVKTVLGHSEAERALQPWWETLEDFLIYGLVLLGIVLVPTAIITGTPLDCNYCQSDYCTSNGTNPLFNNQANGKEDPQFNIKWVKKHCTMSGSVDPFMLYFPYILLIIAMVLVSIEKLFAKAFRAGKKLDKFHYLLVRENILEMMQKPASPQDQPDGARDVMELRQSFKGSTTYFYSYLLRTILEAIVAAVLLVYMTSRGLQVLEEADTIVCDAHGYFYECSGQPAQFYLYILYTTCTITALYILCCIFTVIWLTMPCCGRLSRLMATFKRNMKACKKREEDTDKEILLDLFDMYYKNRDLRLLLDLLTTSSGVAPALAILSVLDKGFREALKPEISFISTSKDPATLEVQIQELQRGPRSVLGDINGVHLIYVAEIFPPVETGAEIFRYVPGTENSETKENIPIDPPAGFSLTASFQGLKEEVNYRITVSTIVNGKTICQASKDIEENSEKSPTAILKTTD